MSEEKSDASIFERVLIIIGFIMIFGGIVWSFTEPGNRWLWFSRYALAMVCFGFAGIMREIRKLRDKDV